MARAIFAPTHDVCAAARFIPEDDTAWDTKRIEAECEAMRKGWDGKGTDPAFDRSTGHVFYRYHQGATRYDLDADGISDYVDFDKKPEIWKMRRLSLEDRAEIRMLVKRDVDRAMRMAICLGCTGLENPSNEAGKTLATELARDKRDNAAILAAFENYSASALVHVATAIQNLSADLDEREKKASGSPAGGQ